MRAALELVWAWLLELRAAAPRDGRRIVALSRADKLANTARLVLLGLVLGVLLGLAALPETRWVA